MAESLTHFLDHHHRLGFLLILLMLTTIPLFVWALNQPKQFETQAYYSGKCAIPKIPRTKVCSTQWVLNTDNQGCRVFACQDNPRAVLP